MTRRLAHRGPDDERLWHDDEAGLSLGFRRLAILDLSAAGAQPMRAASGDVLVFNGEIYNHQALRRRLPGQAWRGRSDSEALLAHLAQFGAEDTLPLLDGMFAFAHWSADPRRLVLARDRFGEKPLFWTVQGGVLAFASELKAFGACPWIRREADAEGVAAVLRFGYAPAPLTCWQGIHRLGAGQMLAFSDDPAAPVRRAWWDAARQAEALAGSFRGSRAEAEAELAERLIAAVTSRREADVPLGLLLSGGLDSGSVAAALAAGGGARSFTLAFPGTRYDEGPAAARLAGALGLAHLSIPMSEAEALAAVPALPAIYDEPFADASAIPTGLLAREMARHVKVALGGDGGDELFAGYPRHRAAAQAGGAPPPAWLGTLLRGLAAAVPVRRWPLAKARRRLLAAAAADPWQARFEAAVSLWHPGELGGAVPVLPGAGRLRGLPSLSRALLSDATTYLPDDLFTKVDRASMAVGLEARSPLLANDLVAFVWSLPEAWRAPAERPKPLLQAFLGRSLPRDLFDRPKQGFEPPLAAWLREGLRDWAEALLEPSRLARSGLVGNVPLLRDAWRRHLAQRGNHTYRLWAVLSVMAWAEHEGLA